MEILRNSSNTYQLLMEMSKVLMYCRLKSSSNLPQYIYRTLFYMDSLILCAIILSRYKSVNDFRAELMQPLLDIGALRNVIFFLVFLVPWRGVRLSPLGTTATN
jgi:hypothetical protein